MSRDRLRVLLVCDLYPPVLGGMELAVQALAQGLFERGHHVEVVTQLAGTSAVPPGATDEHGVVVHRERAMASRLTRAYSDPGFPLHPTVPDPWMVNALRRHVARLRPDVVHAQGWSSYSAMAALRDDHATRLVVGLHDYGLVCANKTLIRTEKGGGRRPCPGPDAGRCVTCSVRHYGAVRGVPVALGLRASSRLHRRVDCFVANSTATADASAAGIPPGAPVVVIPPPVLPATAGLAPPPWLPAGPFVLFVGALGAHKGLDVILAAHTEHGLGAPLVVIGARRHDTPRHWPDGVTVGIDVPHDQVLGAWARASVGVVPSVWPEPFGLVAVEAMQAGVPVVASRTGALVDLVDDGDTGVLVDPGNPAMLAAAVRQLLSEPERAARLGQNALRRSARYATETVVKEVEDLYAQLATTGGPTQMPTFPTPTQAKFGYATVD